MQYILCDLEPLFMDIILIIYVPILGTNVIIKLQRMS